MEIILDINIGSSIRKVLTKKNISQAQLGRMLEKPPTYITRLLNKKTIDTKTLERICDVLDHNFFKEYRLLETKKKEIIGFEVISVHIGWTISSIMKEKKITQAELGEYLGVSHQEISRLLKNVSVDTGKLVLISNFLNYDFFSQFYRDIEKRNDLVMLNKLEQKVAKILWPDIDMCSTSVIPERREFIRKSISQLKLIFMEYHIMEERA